MTTADWYFILANLTVGLLSLGFVVAVFSYFHERLLKKWYPDPPTDLQHR